MVSQNPTESPSSLSSPAPVPPASPFPFQEVSHCHQFIMPLYGPTTLKSRSNQRGPEAGAGPVQKEWAGKNFRVFSTSHMTWLYNPHRDRTRVGSWRWILGSNQVGP